MVSIYRRKLSREEAKLASILIVKTKWGMFPPPGQPLTIEVGGQSFSGAIDAEDCTCVGPLHQHYHLDASAFAPLIDFEAGRILDIEKLAAGRYRLD